MIWCQHAPLSRCTTPNHTAPHTVVLGAATICPRGTAGGRRFLVGGSANELAPPSDRLCPNAPDTCAFPRTIPHGLVLSPGACCRWTNRRPLPLLPRRGPTNGPVQAEGAIGVPLRLVQARAGSRPRPRRASGKRAPYGKHDPPPHGKAGPLRLRQ